MKSLSLMTGAAACFVLAAVLLLGGGLPERATYTGWRIDDEQIVAPEPGFPAPPFTTETLTGASLDLVDLQGTPVVINFWATWCAPCAVEMPELQAFYEQHDDVRVLAINLGETTAAIREWVDSFGLTFDIVPDARQALATLYRVRVQPSTFVIAPDGEIVQVYYGPVTADELESVLSSYLS